MCWSNISGGWHKKAAENRDVLMAGSKADRMQVQNLLDMQCSFRLMKSAVVWLVGCSTVVLTLSLITQAKTGGTHWREGRWQVEKNDVLTEFWTPWLPGARPHYKGRREGEGWCSRAQPA
jgi:hypothetical protein